MKKKLISEINRYREIIGLDPIFEQNIRPNPNAVPTMEVAVNKINQNIMGLSTKIQNDIFEKIPVELIFNEQRTDVVAVKLGSEDFPVAGEGLASLDLPVNKRFLRNDVEFKTNVPLSEFEKDIINTDELKEWYYDKGPYLRNEIANTNIRVLLEFSRDGAIIKRWKGPHKDFKKHKYSVDGIKTNFKLFFNNRGGVYFRVHKKGGFLVEIGGLMIKIPAIIDPPASPDSGGGEPDINTRVAVPETIGLDLVDVFNYDTTDIKDQAKYDEAISKFSEDLNQGIQSIRGYKEFLNGQKTLTVYGYASQDNNPSEKVSGKYSNCKGHGNGTRGDYNMCLSDYRAKKVAEDLQTVFDNVGVNVTIRGVGKGETTKFGKGDGWKDGKKDDESNLSPNRRITFSTPKYKGY